MKDAEVIVKALRCSASAPPESCKGCPYLFREKIEKAFDLPGIVTDADGNKHLECCDCDRIANDAADLIDIVTDADGNKHLECCDCDRIANDAADLIEELMGRPTMTMTCTQNGNHNYCIENCGTLNL